MKSMRCHSLSRFALIIVALALIAAALPAFAQAQPIGSINTGAANLRSGPGIQYGAISTLPFGFGVNLTARNSTGEWVFVTLNNGVTGWVGGGLIFTAYDIMSLPINDAATASAIVPTATVSNVANVNVRTQPDPASAVVTVLANGQQVELIGRNWNSTWANVRLSDGRTGWIVSSALIATVPVRGLAPTDGSVAAPVAPLPGSPGSGTTQTHVVAPGETLSGIAQRYGVSVYALSVANGLANPNYIQAGWVLIIPA
jgi:uncharacterized protein YgiM (DUF1202 family)